FGISNNSAQNHSCLVSLYLNLYIIIPLSVDLKP
ncbi:MAG: hypothetical protein ACI9UT_002799, partial [Flavobacteriales bacterium]